MNSLPMPTVKISNNDFNSDGKIDDFKFVINFKCKPETVRHINVYATFDYFTSKKLKMAMIGMINLNVDTPLGASKIYSDGTLSFN